MADYENKRGVPLQEAEYWDGVYQETGMTKDDLQDSKPNQWIEAVIAVAGPLWDKQKNHLQKNGYLQIDDEVKLPAIPNDL